MSDGKGKGEREKVKGWPRGLPAVTSVWIPLTLSLLHFTLAPSLAQQPALSELPTPVASRTLNLRFTHLSLGDGLSQSSVIDAIQDHNGYMWFATESGLDRYDGFEVKTFYHVPFDPTSLSDRRLLSLLEDRDRNLWIASEGLLMRMDPVSETFEQFAMPELIDVSSIGRDWSFKLIQDHEGIIWAGSTARGLIRFDLDQEPHFRFFKHDPDDPTSIPPGWVLAVFEDAGGALWVKADRYLARMDPDRVGHFTSVDVETSSSRSSWRTTDIYERPSEPGILWVGTYDGLVRYDTGTDEIRRYRVDGDASDPVRVGEIMGDPVDPGILWLGLDDGIARFDILTGRFVRQRNDPTDPASITKGWVMSLERDRQGLLWIGTRGGGVDRMNPGAVGFELVGSRPGGGGLFEGHSVRSILLTNDNVLFVANSRLGEQDRSLLTVLDRNTGASKTFRSDSSPDMGGNFGSLFEDADGTVWIGGGRISRFDRATGRFENLTWNPDDPDHSPPEYVVHMIQDRRGFIWMAGDVISRMDPNDPASLVTFRNDPNNPESIPSGFHIGLDEDAAGFIWMSSVSAGIGRLDPTTGRVVRYEHDPRDPSTIASNRVWDVLAPEHEHDVIYASGSGLSRLDVATGTFRNYTVADGLPDQNVYGALEDERGRIWMSTNHGISRFDPETGTFRNYGLEAGLQSLEFNGESLFKAHTGEMFFGGINGLNAFFPNELIDSSTPPQPRVVEMRIDDVPIEKAPGIELDSTVPDLKNLTLKYEQRNLSLDYNAFHFQTPEKNRYDYKLEGFNDDWIDAGTRRTATFTNLSPGDYTFRLRAANSDGIWSKEDAVLNITILPPWWRTWWAYLLYAGIFAVGVFVVDRVQRTRLLKEERERAQQRELEHAREIEVAYNELRTTQDRLVQSEKMASLGQLTAGIAHEIKNPLNFVNNFSDLSGELADELTAEIAKRRAEIPDDLASDIEDIVESLKMNVQKIHEHGKRADSIVYGMLQHSRTGEVERAETDINALVDEHLNLAYHGMRARLPDFNATLETDYDKSVGTIEVVPQDLGRVMLNLIGNAFDALNEFGSGDKPATVSVSTTRSNGQVVIRVHDNGPGIPPEVKSKIFEPFFTTKPAGSGTGLGLSMSYDIITKGHGGQLDVVSEPGKGATFVVTLPAS